MMRFFSLLFGFVTLSVLAFASFVAILYWYYSKDLPTYDQLAEYHPPVISRVYSEDGKLIGEFAKERRLYTPIEGIPDQVKNAFIAAEDQNFYNHPGVDFTGIMRAMVTNVMNIGEGRRLQGASTITQQVMKNFLLSSERKIERKIKEAILATRFEKTFTKDHILELYLNEIFLGAGTYGVTAAAQAYFGKTLDKLTLSEAAYLAGLPKGPNNYHPERYKKRAISRRNYVISRMLNDDYITEDEAENATLAPLMTVMGQKENNLDTSYFVEEVRRDLLSQYGESVLYNAGLTITATIDPELQKNAEKALRGGLINMDKTLGWRGPIAEGLSVQNPKEALEDYSTPRDLYDWRIAVVTSFSQNGNVANIYIKEDEKEAYITFETSKWARSNGKKPDTMQDILKKGDVIYVTRNMLSDVASEYLLRQIPKVNGAIMVMDPHTGRVLAQQGGFSFSQSQFNRATQAKRQPGSAFKPFVYAAALEQGYRPTTLINDGPFYYKDDLGRIWKPENYDKTYLGNIPMRKGLERSRNLMTIRIAQDIGMENVIAFAERFGVGDKMKPYLPMSLGAGETTLEKMVTAYAAFANGGKKVRPVYYDRVQNRSGKNILTADIPLCSNCLDEGDISAGEDAEYLLDPVTNHYIVSLLQGVVERGTGRTLKSLGAPIAGKTGTTNESKDVWFLGFTSNLAFGTYIGYDNPKPMGRRVTGGGTAAPIIKAFLRPSLEITKATAFYTPPGIVSKNHYASEQHDHNAPHHSHGVSNAQSTKQSDYYMPEKIDNSGDMINLGTGGLY
ncbi:MAG: penicillin-binding protein 1A [Pseudomonadota bacterium]